jgi:hypothetical protein
MSYINALDAKGDILYSFKKRLGKAKNYPVVSCDLKDYKFSANQFATC